MQSRSFFIILLVMLLAGLTGEAWAARKAGPEFRVNTHDEDVDFGAAVAALRDGGFVTTWFAYRGDSFDVYAQRYGGTGQPSGGEFPVNTFNGPSQLDPDVAGLRYGGFVVVWKSFGQDGSLDGIYGQRYNQQGAAVGDEFRVNTNTLYDQQHPSIAGLSGGGFVVVWDSYIASNDTSIYAQRYNAQGSPVGSEFRVNRVTENGGRRQPFVASLKDGAFVVVWRSSGTINGIYGQRFDRRGRRLGPQFRVSGGDFDTWGHQLAGLKDGGFIVTWYNNVEGIFARRYDADGAAVGAAFRVNPDPHYSYVEPSVAGLSDGGFVFTYVSELADKDDVVVGREYDAAGIPEDPFFINTFGVHSLDYPTAAGLTRGRFVVIWIWDDPDESQQVRGQRFR